MQQIVNNWIRNITNHSKPQNSNDGLFKRIGDVLTEYETKTHVKVK